MAQLWAVRFRPRSFLNSESFFNERGKIMKFRVFLVNFEQFSLAGAKAMKDYPDFKNYPSYPDDYADFGEWFDLPIPAMGLGETICEKIGSSESGYIIADVVAETGIKAIDEMPYWMEEEVWDVNNTLWDIVDYKDDDIFIVNTIMEKYDYEFAFEKAIERYRDGKFDVINGVFNLGDLGYELARRNGIDMDDEHFDPIVDFVLWDEYAKSIVKNAWFVEDRCVVEYKE